MSLLRLGVLSTIQKLDEAIITTFRKQAAAINSPIQIELTNNAITSEAVALDINNLSAVKKIEVYNLSQFGEHVSNDTILSNFSVLVGEPAAIAPKMQFANNLAWVHSTFAGIEPFIKEAEKHQETEQSNIEEPFKLTRTVGNFGPLMSEFVFSYILAKERHVNEMKQCQVERDWAHITFRNYRSLKNLTIGILGCGAIGSHIARTSKLGFDMKVLAVKNDISKVPAHVDACYNFENLNHFLANSDYIVNILPSTPHTYRLLENDLLKHCKPTAHFINVGRGNIISEESLLRAVDSSWIKGALLDVFEVEPLSEDSKLWENEKITISPHVAAVGFPEDVAANFTEEFFNFASQSPPARLVNWQKGY